MAGIGIIANPHSKLNKRNPEQTHLLSYIAGKTGIFKITNNLDELRKVANDFQTRAIQILAINGGDGTISRTITAFIHAYQGKPLPKIVLLGGGTMNMLANNLQIYGNPEEILSRLLFAHSAKEGFSEFSIDSIKVKNNYGFLYADGVSVSFLKEFYKNKTGSLGVVALCLKVGLSSIVNGSLYNSMIKSQSLSVSSQTSETMELSALSIFCSTVEEIPMHIKMFQKPKKNNEFNVLLLNLKPRDLLWKFIPHFLMSPYKEGCGKIRFTTPFINLNYRGPQPYSIDGEIFYEESGSIKVEKGPRIDFLRI